MIFTETPLPGAFTVDLAPIEDERGFFARSFSEEAFTAHGLEARFVQCNISHNRRRGTLRGLHFAAPPHDEVKLVRCTRGALWDVIVDLRPGSPTRGRWFAATLDAENRRALYVPRGFAHGFQTLVDDTEVFYQMSASYVAAAARGVRHDDPQLGIPWPLPERILSERDRGLPLFAELGETLV